MIGADDKALTRVIRTQLFIMMFDENSFDFAATVPAGIDMEYFTWRLKWPDQASFNDPSGFFESDYDGESLILSHFEWDDPELPSEVLSSAIQSIDWHGTGEWLEDWIASGGSLENAPNALRPYLLDAIALHRRQTNS